MINSRAYNWDLIVTAGARVLKNKSSKQDTINLNNIFDSSIIRTIILKYLNFNVEIIFLK